MTVRTKSAFLMIGLAVAASACGSTSSVSSTTSTTLPDYAQSVAAQYCDAPVPNTPPPPSGTVEDPNGGPTAQACWADGLWVGQGSLTDKKIIFADKEVNLAAGMITPQGIRKDPTTAEHDFIATTDRYASQKIVSTYWDGLKSLASAGDVQVDNDSASVDPTGIVDADFTVVPLGVKFISNPVEHDIPAGPFTEAKVQACVNSHISTVSPAGSPLAGAGGKGGNIAWTDTLQLTKRGWEMVGTTASKVVPSCS